MFLIELDLQHSKLLGRYFFAIVMMLVITLLCWVQHLVLKLFACMLLLMVSLYYYKYKMSALSHNLRRVVFDGVYWQLGFGDRQCHYCHLATSSRLVVGCVVLNFHHDKKMCGCVSHSKKYPLRVFINPFKSSLNSPQYFKSINVLVLVDSVPAEQWSAIRRALLINPKKLMRQHQHSSVN